MLVISVAARDWEASLVAREQRITPISWKVSNFHGLACGGILEENTFQKIKEAAAAVEPSVRGKNTEWDAIPPLLHCLESFGISTLQNGLDIKINVTCKMKKRLLFHSRCSSRAYSVVSKLIIAGKTAQIVIRYKSWHFELWRSLRDRIFNGTLVQ